MQKPVIHENDFYSYANDKTHFHKKGFAVGLGF